MMWSLIFLISILFGEIKSHNQLPQRRVSLGNPPPSKDYPYTSQVEISIHAGDLTFVCSGTIITEFKVLTCAHCFARASPNDSTVVVRYATFDSERGATATVSKWVTYPKRKYDLAVALVTINRERIDILADHYVSTDKWQLTNEALNKEFKTLMCGWGMDETQEVRESLKCIFYDDVIQSPNCDWRW